MALIFIFLLSNSFFIAVVRADDYVFPKELDMWLERKIVELERAKQPLLKNYRENRRRIEAINQTIKDLREAKGVTEFLLDPSAAAGMDLKNIKDPQERKRQLDLLQERLNKDLAQSDKQERNLLRSDKATSHQIENLHRSRAQADGLRKYLEKFKSGLASLDPDQWKFNANTNWIIEGLDDALGRIGSGPGGFVEGVRHGLRNLAFGEEGFIDLKVVQAELKKLTDGLRKAGEYNVGKPIIKVIRVGGRALLVVGVIADAGFTILDIYTFEGDFLHKLAYAGDQFFYIPFTPKIGLTENLFKISAGGGIWIHLDKKKSG